MFNSYSQLLGQLMKLSLSRSDILIPLRLNLFGVSTKIFAKDPKLTLVKFENSIAISCSEVHFESPAKSKSLIVFWLDSRFEFYMFKDVIILIGYSAEISDRLP